VLAVDLVLGENNTNNNNNNTKFI